MQTERSFYPLLPYQRAWVGDESRFKIWLASRQVGKSFAAACEVVRESYAHPNSLWLVLSAGERQALEFMEKVRRWTAAMSLQLMDAGLIATGAEIGVSQVCFPNRSRILALPANPDTARGYSANLVLDEFAFHQDSGAIWRSVFPSITNPLRGRLKVRILSTPNGKANAFHELWHAAGSHAPGGCDGDRWSRHRTTIHDAIAAGLPVDVAALRRQISDPDGWAQEFECQFLDLAEALLPFELIEACEDPALTCGGAPSPNVSTQAPEAPTDAMGPWFLGVDIGRHRDLTVLWALEPVRGVFITRAVLVLERSPFQTQLQTIRSWLASQWPRVARLCLDATGMGIMLGEELVREFGADRVEACSFTSAFKAELFLRLRQSFEDRALRIPCDPLVRSELRSLKRLTAPGGQLRVEAPSGPGGHADRATALALACRAARAAASTGYCRAFVHPRRRRR